MNAPEITKTELRKTLDELERLRDEIRVNAHLAAMDAKDRWHELEPQVEKAEHKAREALHEVVLRARSVRDAIRGKPAS